MGLIRILEADDPNKKDNEGKFKDLRTKCKDPSKSRINKIRFTPDSM